mmetsp:Transcript_4929/g.17587  ORF Transcript_4929/g.17587 Transcript_4929/m.17587 type:complete len:351 (+) Transcript_4929:34-1086(+)
MITARGTRQSTAPTVLKWLSATLSSKRKRRARTTPPSTEWACSTFAGETRKRTASYSQSPCVGPPTFRLLGRFYEQVKSSEYYGVALRSNARRANKWAAHATRAGFGRPRVAPRLLCRREGSGLGRRRLRPLGHARHRFKSANAGRIILHKAQGPAPSPADVRRRRRPKRGLGGEADRGQVRPWAQVRREAFAALPRAAEAFKPSQTADVEANAREIEADTRQTAIEARQAECDARAAADAGHIADLRARALQLGNVKAQLWRRSCGGRRWSRRRCRTKNARAAAASGREVKNGVTYDTDHRSSARHATASRASHWLVRRCRRQRNDNFMFPSQAHLRSIVHHVTNVATV